MGLNDGGGWFDLKARNREIYLDFIGEPADTERRLQNNTAMHQDYFVTSGQSTVHIVLLDIRYEYDKESGDKVGAEQWSWLDLAFKRGKANDVNMTILGISIQTLSERELFESFSVQNKKKLFEILSDNRMENVGMISGDLHMA